MVAAVSVGLEALVQGVIDEWGRSGARGAQELIWALAPEDQVRVLIDLYNRRELEPLVSGIHESFVHDMRPTGIPGMEIYRGPDGYRRFLHEWLDAFPESQLDVEAIETAGPMLLAVVHQEVRGAGSGVPVLFTYAAVLTFSDAQAVASEFYMDVDAARARFEQLAGARLR